MSKEYRNEFDTLEIEVEMEREEACRWLSGEYTLFDRITASPEVLALQFIEKQEDQWDDDDYAYYSYLTKEWYATEDKAFAATVAKLKEVYNG